MGFWDFYAADRETFVQRVAALGVPVLPVGGVLVPIEEAAAVAYGQPAQQLGMLVRLLISGSVYSVNPTSLGAIAGDLNAQAQSAGFGQGGGFGGSFGFQAERLGEMVTIIPNAYRVSIEAVSGGQPVTNVVGVINGGGTALGAAQAVQAAWKVTAGPMSQQRSDYALQGFRALDMSDANGDIAFVADSTVGSIAAGSKSTNAACALVKWNGGTRSRSSRGRLYFGPIGEGAIDADGRTLASASRTALETAMTNFRTSLSSAGYPLAVLSLTTSSAFLVTSSAVETIIATQRRRIRG